MKRMNYKDNFEMLYLRHEYLNKCERLRGEFVEEYEPIVKTTARIMFDKLYPNYCKVGFNRDDIISITNMYMLGYMELYSLRFNEEAREKFIESHKERFDKEPTYTEIYNKDKNNLINFLRQRLQHCSTICARKARSITVGIDRRGFFAMTKYSIPASDECILNNYKELGYRKVTRAEFKEAKEKAKILKESTITDKDGFKIIQVQILNSGIGHNDYSLLVNSNRSLFNMNPEDRLEHIESENNLKQYKAKFDNMDVFKKRETLKRFVRKNKENKYLKKELALVRKMLKKSDFVV